jgi:hypothetical protein
MTATHTTTPPPAGLDPAELFEPDRRDWLRMLGGVLLAAGCAVLYIRKFEEWGDFPLLLVVLLPFLALYGLGWLAGTRHRDDGAERPEGWQIVFLIAGSLLAGLVVAQLIMLLGADDLNARLHQVLIGLAVAAAAYAASFLRRIPALALIGGLAALWAWIFLWDKLTEIDTIGSARLILLIFAAMMLAAGIALRTAGREQADDFITVAGATAIIVGLLSISNLTGAADPVGDDETRPSETWNVFILIVSVALITFGARARTRGPSYVGAIGLASFVGLTGANVVALTKGNSDDVSKFAGWPLLLLLLGLAALAASFLMPRSPGRGWWQTTAPDAGPQPGGAPAAQPAASSWGQPSAAPQGQPPAPPPQGQVPPAPPQQGQVPPDRPTQVQPQPDQPTRAYPQQPPPGQPPGGQPPG